MPYVKCSKCMHEWETTDLKENCRWCKSPIGKVLEEKTPLERMLMPKPMKILLEYLKEKANVR